MTRSCLLFACLFFGCSEPRAPASCGGFACLVPHAAVSNPVADASVDGGDVISDAAAAVDGNGAAVDAGNASGPSGKAVGQECRSDEECGTGLCVGVADDDGALSGFACRAECLPSEDYGAYCQTDTHCCAGTCCLACGDLEGLCVDD